MVFLADAEHAAEAHDGEQDVVGRLVEDDVFDITDLLPAARRMPLTNATTGRQDRARCFENSSPNIELGNIARWAVNGRGDPMELHVGARLAHFEILERT
jgi:hypothetical protein